MTPDINRELFSKLIFQILTETFEKVEGLYLDRGTSLFETLAPVTAAQASRPICEGGTSIAAQTAHTRFYLQVLQDYLQGKWYEKVDWQSSWQTRTVTDAEWDTLRRQLRDEYQQVLTLLHGFEDWSDEKKLEGTLGIIAHTAYHLGSIRQMVKVVNQ